MKIIVSGGLGYIGSHTVIELINNGYTPIIIDNLSNSEEVMLDKLHKITRKKVDFHLVIILLNLNVASKSITLILSLVIPLYRFRFKH